MPDFRKLLVIGVDDPLRANEFVLAVLRMRRRGLVQVHDAVFVERDAEGRSTVQETQDIATGHGVLGSALWGVLIGTLLGDPVGGLTGGQASAGRGALLARLVDTGINDERIATLRGAVPPGGTALALLVSRLSVADLERELARFPGATLVEFDLPDAAVALVRDALAEAQGIRPDGGMVTEVVTVAVLRPVAGDEPNPADPRPAPPRAVQPSTNRSPGAAPDRPTAGGVGFPVTIYLSDESIHGQVESAVENLVAVVGFHIEQRDDPLIGSWFRRMRATTREVVSSAGAREAAMTAAHSVDVRLVLAQDAAVTATMLQNLGPLITALQPTKDAVVRVGALLIVKANWGLTVHQLTAAQQLQLDHRPNLAAAPDEILTALTLTINNSTSSSACQDRSISPHEPLPTPDGKGFTTDVPPT